MKALVLCLAALLTGCASAPVAPPVVVPAAVSLQPARDSVAAAQRSNLTAAQEIERALRILEGTRK